MTVSPDNLTLPLVFCAGILGSSHCLGMCGAISVAMSAGTTSVRQSIARQVTWSAGRCVTYSFLGITAATLGRQLTMGGSSAVLWQAGLAITAGVLMVVQGLHAAGRLSLPTSLRLKGVCPATGMLKAFLQGGSVSAVFVAGLITGFLPCGLVYSFLLLAAASGDVLTGALIMVCFGAGTVPVMVVTGTGLSLLQWSVRRRMLRSAAWCVVLAGVLTTGRGFAAAMLTTDDGAAAACPLCVDDRPPGAAPSDRPGTRNARVHTSSASAITLQQKPAEGRFPEARP